MTGHLIKKPESAMKNIEIQKPLSTAQQAEGTSQKTITVWSKAGRTVTLEQIDICDEFEVKEKSDDESREEQSEVDVSDGSKDQEDSNDETSEEEPIVDFEDPLYELSQGYEIESEYEDMTIEQEIAEFKMLTPHEQAKYHELKQFHQCQAELNKEITGISTIIKEWTNAKMPGILTDLIKRHVQEEPLECQEIEKMTEKQRVHTLLKQDKIPRSDQPGTTKGYYLYMEDDQGCMIEQEDGTLVPDTEAEQVFQWTK